jgi:hypothetical protein
MQTSSRDDDIHSFAHVIAACRLAGWLVAIGVAFCPTKPAVCAAGAGACPASSVTHLPASQEVAGDIHLFFAAATFAMLGLIALRFAKSGRTSRLVNDSRDLPRHDCR